MFFMLPNAIILENMISASSADSFRLPAGPFLLTAATF